MQNLLILSCLSDFMTCRKRFNIQSEGSISQIWDTVGRYNFFETCRKRFYNQNRGYISQLWKNVGRRNLEHTFIIISSSSIKTFIVRIYNNHCSSAHNNKYIVSN